MQTSQKRAVRNYRDRQAAQGLARFEVQGLDMDRKLIRTLARRLAAGGQEATQLRAALGEISSTDKPSKGGILAALRRSPMVGAALDTARPKLDGRKVDI